MTGARRWGVAVTVVVLGLASRSGAQQSPDSEVDWPPAGGSAWYSYEFLYPGLPNWDERTFCGPEIHAQAACYPLVGDTFTLGSSVSYLCLWRDEDAPSMAVITRRPGPGCEFTVEPTDLGELSPPPAFGNLDVVGVGPDNWGCRDPQRMWGSDLDWDGLESGWARLEISVEFESPARYLVVETCPDADCPEDPHRLSAVAVDLAAASASSRIRLTRWAFSFDGCVQVTAVGVDGRAGDSRRVEWRRLDE